MENYPKPSKLEFEDIFSESESDIIESESELDQLSLECEEDLELEDPEFEKDYFDELFYFHYNSFGEIVIIYKKDKEVYKVLKITEDGPISINPNYFIYTDKFRQFMGFETQCKPKLVGKNTYDNRTEICYEIHEDGQFIIHVDDQLGLVERIEYEGVNNYHEVNYIENY